MPLYSKKENNATLPSGTAVSLRPRKRKMKKKSATLSSGTIQCHPTLHNYSELIKAMVRPKKKKKECHATLPSGTGW